VLATRVVLGVRAWSAYVGALACAVAAGADGFVGGAELEAGADQIAFPLHPAEALVTTLWGW